VPSGTPVIRSQVNRVPEPKSDNFVMMTPILRTRLATNTDTYIDSPGIPLVGLRNTLLAMQSGEGVPSISIRNSLSPMEVTIQLDVHGMLSADNIQMISTLMRDEYATTAFRNTGYDVQPLYTSEPHEAPFDNAEQQTEWRWILDVCLQCNPVITTSQDFFDQVVIKLINVDGGISVDREVAPTLMFNNPSNSMLRMMGWN